MERGLSGTAVMFLVLNRPLIARQTGAGSTEPPSEAGPSEVGCVLTSGEWDLSEQ
jgi:hypothetical protein